MREYNVEKKKQGFQFKNDGLNLPTVSALALTPELETGTESITDVPALYGTFLTQNPNACVPALNLEDRGSGEQLFGTQTVVAVETLPNKVTSETFDSYYRSNSITSALQVTGAPLELVELCNDDLTAEGYTATQIHENPQLLESRVAQQQLVASVPGIVDLAAPGSQAGNYVLGADGRPEHVYYSSYGSNLFQSRFNAYIEGGQPDGSARTYDGARDKTLPTDDIPVALNGTVHYAGNSTVWTGGAGFLDPTTKGKSLGRAYRIKAAQFDDVVAQECKQAPGSKTVDLTKIIKDGQSVETGLYGALIHVGDYNNVPVFSFTGAFTTAEARKGGITMSAHGNMVPADSQEATETVGAVKPFPIFTNKPADAYRHMISSGLAEAHSLTQSQADVYFAGSAGVQILV